MPDMNLILIGYRATGKSAVGRLLAHWLGWPFLDTDALVEKRAGRTIDEIVKTHGWDEFRRLEKETVAAVCQADRQVIATGGGVILDPENIEQLRRAGSVIWLQADINDIEERLKQSRARPSLTGGDTISEAAQVLAERLPAYQRAAHLQIDTAGMMPSEVAEKILALHPGLSPRENAGRTR